MMTDGERLKMKYDENHEIPLLSLPSPESLSKERMLNTVEVWHKTIKHSKRFFSFSTRAIAVF
jgi:hypothetical protein